MLVCLMTMFINMTTTFNQQDAKAFTSAQNRCKVLTGEPCLRSFQKREDGVYRAFCGEKQHFNKKELIKAEMNAIMRELDHLDKEDKKKALKKIGVGYEI
jgi:hypothetical protein